MKRYRSALWFVMLFALFYPSVAAAHPIKGVGDFYAGTLHPLTAFEFLLPWIALALFAGQQRRSAALWTLCIFPLALILGAVSALAVRPAAWVSSANLVMIPLLGLAVALSLPCPTAVPVGLATVLGLLHGLANGTEITASISPWRFIPGLATAGILVLSYGIGLVRSLKKPWTRMAVRVVGSWIAAAGILVCAFQLAAATQPERHESKAKVATVR